MGTATATTTAAATATATSTTAVHPEIMPTEMQQNLPNQDASELSRSPQDQYACGAWSASEPQQQVSAMNEIGRKVFHPGMEKEPQFDLNQDEIMWDLQAQLPTQPPVYNKPGMFVTFSIPMSQFRTLA